MSVFLARVLNFTIVPLIFAYILIRQNRKQLGKVDRLELYLIYLFGVGVAGSGIGGFFGHIFLSDVVAQSVGWPSGSPFQLEMGFANLALGVLGIMATSRLGEFRSATTIAVTVIGVGASVVHLYDILQTGNLAPGNTIQNFANLVRPALLILFLRAQHQLLPKAEPRINTAEWQTWQVYHAQSAGIIAALIATGFGMGYAFEVPGLGSLVAILIGAAILVLRRNPARP